MMVGQETKDEIDLGGKSPKYVLIASQCTCITVEELEISTMRK